MKATCTVAEWMIIRNWDLISLLITDQSTFECSFVRASPPPLVWEDLYNWVFFHVTV